MLLHKYFGFFLCLYLQIINISCDEGGSLAFAIDDTASMGDDIYYVRKGAQAIMKLVLSNKSDIKELVLVTFNDPDVELRTRNSSQHTFLNDLASIYPHGGGDCPEMALTGMETALTASNPGSYIFVFTDANAKDYYKVNKIRSLCQKKQSQVIIVYSKDRHCYRPQGTEFNVYYDIAKACSGQVFIVEKDQVDSILKTIETLLQGKNSIFKWITIERTIDYVPVEFTLDEKAEYAIVSTSGTNVGLKVTKDKYFNSPEVLYEKTMWTYNGKVVKLINPNPGTYYAWVKGDSTISVVIYGRTDFTFQHGFSILEPKLLSDTAKQPIAGLKQYVSINVTDPDHSVNIKTVQILDIKNNDHVISEFPLRNIDKDFYITDSFVSPNFTFRIAVKGEIKKTRESITRFSKNIDPRIVDLIPESLPDIKIEEGVKLDVEYGSSISLTCKVNGHPAPKIEWYTSSGRLLESKSSVIDDPLFVSYLKLENIKHTDTYICKASNKRGSGRESRIEVGIKPIFIINGDAAYHTKFGEDVKIPCNIKSYLPITTKWFRSGKLLSANSGEHSISPDGSELTLKSMDIQMQGKYTCEATLSSNPTIKQTRDRDVIISDLASPKVTNATWVLKEKKFTAICRISGIPKPIISWQFKLKGSEEISTLPETGEELNISDMTLRNSGLYKCTAKNIFGKTENDFNVVVEERPIIYNEETAYYGVEGDLVMKMFCNVSGFPEPVIVWKKANEVLKADTKHKVQGATLYINKPVQTDSGEYTCQATNKLGIASKTFVVEIVDNFEGDENFNGDSHDVYVEEGKRKVIKCNLKNSGEGSIRWYKDGVLNSEIIGSTYIIENPSILDEGNYTCRVNTEEGSKSETYVVYVGTIPAFVSSAPNTIEWQFDDQVLDCTADSQPPATYEWIHNGKTVETGKYLGEVVITGWGEYKCIVSNGLGNISRSFKITTSGCYLTKYVIAQNQPLVSDASKPTWLTPTGNSDIILEEKQEVKLTCASTKYSTNTFKIMPDKKEIMAKCDSQDKFTINGKSYKYSDLQCNTAVEPVIKKTGTQCSGPNSEIIRVGFEVNGSLDVYKVCYDKNQNVPLYANPLTFMSRYGEGIDSMKFVWTSVPGLSTQNTGNWEREGSCKCCYYRGQLVNVRDVAFGPAQASTFKDSLNSIPIWEPSCSNSERTSWQSFENEIRVQSFEYNKWSSWTGASDYVAKAGGLVPRFLWKAVDNDEGTTVMVYVNDEKPVDSDIRCSSNCRPLIDSDKFLYCCTPEEFSRKFRVPLHTFITG